MHIKAKYGTDKPTCYNAVKEMLSQLSVGQSKKIKMMDIDERPIHPSVVSDIVRAIGKDAGIKYKMKVHVYKSHWTNGWEDTRTERRVIEVTNTGVSAT